jgi:hypothetical protein
LILLWALVSTMTFATPDSVEIWFVSEPDQSQVFLSPLLRDTYQTFSATALKCIKMGDHCFDPQVGLYKDSAMGDFEAAPDMDMSDEMDKVESARSLDRQLVECRKRDNHFDVFCGKAKDFETSSNKLQVWIDTSSSMSRVDPSDLSKECYRKSFVRRFRNSCTQVKDVDFYVFDTHKKQLGDLYTLCNNVGLNDRKKIIQWIKNSKVKKLIIITDIYELNVELTDYIDSIGGIMRGGDMKKPLDAKSMLDLIPKVAKSCK